MNLIDQLMKADVKKADELSTGTYQSKKLAKLLGVEDAVTVTYQEVRSRRLNDIVAYQVDRKGNFDFSKSFDAKLMMVVEGLVDPDLKNKDLQKYFGCNNARELAEKIFGAEINELSDAISSLSGITSDGDEDLETEIKN